MDYMPEVSKFRIEQIMDELKDAEAILADGF